MPALDEARPAPPAVVVALAPPSRPRWLRWRLFRFVGSIQLAVVLLGVVIVASIFGTIYESGFDADVARAYIYGAAWFNLWLLFLALNLAASAASRWPWQRRHTGFLITHLGIIILLAGALIGRTWGVEGTMTLFKGRAPDNRLLVSQRQLYVTEGGEPGRSSPVTFPVRVVGRRPSAAKPWTLGRTPGGWTVELTDYAPHLASRFQPEVPTLAAGQPAVHLRLVSPRLGRTMERWLLAGDEEHDAFDLGMASVRLLPGAAPAAAGDAKPETVPPGGEDRDPVDENIVAFAKRPGEQAGQAAPGKMASGAKVRLSVGSGGRRLVNVEWRGAAWEFDADADRGKDEDLGHGGLFVRIGDFWPDFTLRDGQPATASAEPNNPAVLVRVHGRLTANADGETVAAADDPNRLDANATSPTTAAANAATLYCDAAGALTYSLRSGGSPQPVRGTLTPGQPINTGWADWQIVVDQVLPRAVEHTVFEPSETRPKGAGPMAGDGGSGTVTDGVRVRLSRPGQPTHEQWVGAGWQVTTPTTGGADDRPVQLVYGWQIEPLPIGLELTNFEVERNEGTDDPAGFRSTVRVTATDGATDAGSCWMNHPHNFPGSPLHTWTGFTYKISQASWNPDNLDQSSVQILRDPGWSLKWVGCLLVCAGIVTLFYGRPHPGETAAARARVARPN